MIEIVELSLPTNVEVGQSVTLLCIGFGGHDKEVKITWMIGSLVVSNSLGESVHEDHYVVDARKVKRSFFNNTNNNDGGSRHLHMCSCCKELLCKFLFGPFSIYTGKYVHAYSYLYIYEVKLVVKPK